MTPEEIRVIIANLLSGTPNDDVNKLCIELLNRLPRPYVGRYGRVCHECNFKMRGLRTCECPNCGNVMREKTTYGAYVPVMSVNDCRSCGSECFSNHKRGPATRLQCGCVFHRGCLLKFIHNGSRSCPAHRNEKIKEDLICGLKQVV
jgi:hypothetical protein